MQKQELLHATILPLHRPNECGSLRLIDVYGLTFPTPYPTKRPRAPPIDPADNCILWFVLSLPANTSPAETANNKRAVTSTASSDLLFFGFPAWPPRLIRVFPTGRFIASSSRSMRLISFSGSVGFVHQRWQRHESYQQLATANRHAPRNPFDLRNTLSMRQWHRHCSVSCSPSTSNNRCPLGLWTCKCSSSQPSLISLQSCERLLYPRCLAAPLMLINYICASLTVYYFNRSTLNK